MKRFERGMVSLLDTVIFTIELGLRQKMLA
jgi:hypothetical protein